MIYLITEPHLDASDLNILKLRIQPDQKLKIKIKKIFIIKETLNKRKLFMFIKKTIIFENMSI